MDSKEVVTVKKSEKKENIKKENVKGLDKKRAKEEKKEELTLKEDEVREVIVEKSAGFNFIEVVIIMIITLIFGGLAGAFIMYTAGNQMFLPTMENGDKVPSELVEFLEVYNELKENYYDTIDPKELSESGIKGLLSYLGDPFSSYMSEEETEAFNQQVAGYYVGIGAEVAQYTDGRVVIHSLFDNGAAMNAGLMVDDQIIKVENESVEGMELSDISDLLKGAEGTSVNVTILRGEEEMNFTLVRRKVDIKSVTSDVIETEDKKIGKITIDIFAENTYDQFEQELTKLEADGIEALIIDVRNNAGGHLSVVENIASLFIPKGHVIYQLETKGIKQPIYSTSNSTFKLPVVVLINGASASASEILAAALKESYGATLVGTTTYGKGTVQTTHTLSSGSQIKYTIQKWLTPNGNWVNEKGIDPDIEVKKEDGDFSIEADGSTDQVLDKAIEVLTTE